MIGSFILTVDIEPDERLLERRTRPEWQGFLDVLRWMEPLRERLARVTGRPASFNWFLRMDPQIEEIYGDIGWAARRYTEELAKLRSAGDTIGLHHHAFRWNASEDRWVSDHADEAWIDDGVASAFQGFVREFGVRPRLFRFGDRWLSDRLVARLDRLGIACDLTLEPGMRAAPAMVAAEGGSGELPGYRNALRRPYHPAIGSYLEQGRLFRRRRLWMVPVSTGCVNGPPLPARILPEHDFVHLNLGLDPRWIRHILDGVLEAEEPIVVSVARSGDLAFPRGRDFFLENIEYLASHPRIAERIFEKPAAAVARWRKNRNAN